MQVPVLVSTISAYLLIRLLGTPSLFDAFVSIKNLPGATTKGVPLAVDVYALLDLSREAKMLSSVWSVLALGDGVTWRAGVG